MNAKLNGLIDKQVGETSAGCCQAASMAAGLRQAPSTTFDLLMNRLSR